MLGSEKTLKFPRSEGKENEDGIKKERSLKNELKNSERDLSSGKRKKETCSSTTSSNKQTIQKDSLNSIIIDLNQLEEQEKEKRKVEKNGIEE